MEESIEEILKKCLKVKIAQKEIKEKTRRNEGYIHNCIQVSLLFNNKVISTDKVILGSSYYNDNMPDFLDM